MKDAGAGPPKSDPEDRRIEKMGEEPYHGPGNRHGISAHGIDGETDLRRAKQYAEMIVDTVREGLLVLDLDLYVEAANESFYRMFEVTPDDIEGRLIYELGNGQWGIPELRSLLEGVLPQKKVMTGFEVVHEFENVGERVMLLNARQLDDHQLILLAIEDVTEQEETEELLRANEEKLREMNRSLEKRVQERTATLREQAGRLRRLAADLASAEQRERRRLAALLHDDLQQRLYGIEIQLTVARGKAQPGSPVADVIDEASDQVEGAVEAARDLTRQLRPPALYEAGLVPALRGLASSMAEQYGLNVTMETHGVKAGLAKRALGDDINAMLFDGVRELLFNVVKHADVGEARLLLQVDTDARDADYLHLIVEDKGCGFDVETTPETGSGKGDEAGFGLFSVRERIAALGGSMTIESSPGAGTRIKLALPFTAGTGEAVPLAEAGGGDEEGRPEAMPHRTKVRVVVADDHTVVRQGIANLLVGDGRTEVVGEAADGHEAIEAVEQFRPDVVLMDVNMPKMNGIEATRQIRRRWPETAVIGLSVQADHATRQSMLDADAVAFVPKSGDVDQIIETVLRVAGCNSEVEG